MNTERFVCWVLGIDGKVIDRLCDEFDIDLTTDDIQECLEDGIDRKWGTGMELLMLIYDRIVERYSQQLDSDKFDYDFSSPSYPSFYYNGKTFNTKEGLAKIVKEG